MSKESVYLNIPIIGRVITIWEILFCKIRVSIDGLVTKNKFLLESIHRIDTHIDVVVEVIKVGSSVSFDFCLDEEFIEPC